MTSVGYGPEITRTFWTPEETRHQGYPTSKSDILELDGKTLTAAAFPEITKVTSANGVPELSWNVNLGDKVQVKYCVKVLPGLPVTLESREEIIGWDGQGRLLCSGLRFATIKDASSSYGVCSTALSDTVRYNQARLDNHVVWAGVYGLYERMSNDAKLPLDRRIFLNNGYFGAICLYDPKPVAMWCADRMKWRPGSILNPRLVLM